MFRASSSTLGACVLVASAALGCAAPVRAVRPPPPSRAEHAPSPPAEKSPAQAQAQAPTATPTPSEAGVVRLAVGESAPVDGGRSLRRTQGSWLELSAAPEPLTGFMEKGEGQKIGDLVVYRLGADGADDRSPFLVRHTPALPIRGTLGTPVALGVGEAADFAHGWRLEVEAIYHPETTGDPIRLHVARDGVEVMQSNALDVGSPTDFFDHHTLETTRVALRAVSFANDPTKTRVELVMTPIATAKPARYGEPLGNGLYAMSDGARLFFEKRTMCASGKVECVCTTTYELRFREAGESMSASITIDANKSVDKGRVRFRVDRDDVRVSRRGP
jgi:hypothetical protein